MTAATKVTSPGRSTSAAAVPDSWARVSWSRSPRSSVTAMTATAPSAAASRAENERRPKPMGLARSAATSTRASAPATAAATRRPVLERVECASTSPTGASARDATTAPAAVPSAQPTAVPTTATAAASVPVKRESCQRLAPNHVSRRRAASVSRRMLTAARIANAKRSAADSPPTSRSLRPATSLDSDAVWRSASGAVRSAAKDVF